MFFDFYPLYRIILGRVRQEIIGIVKKDPCEHKRKKLPLKKKHPERKKVLKIAESTIFKLFLAFNTSAIIYDVFKMNRSHTKILKIL